METWKARRICGNAPRQFSGSFVLLASLVLVLLSALCHAATPNLLIITVDDMSCDSVGAFGCPLKGTTPHIDQLAAEGLRYHYAHVQTGSCYPSRNVMFSGRYSHNTGVEGFYQVKDAQYPHLVDLFQAAGYFVAIRGKVSHSTPYRPYHWDADLTTLDGEPQHIKDASSYYRSTRRGIELAGKAGKPFCLNINISDPHKPFYAMTSKGERMADPHVPSQIFTPAEVPIPGFLFDHPQVRLELSHYYSSVRRADDCVGEVLRALREGGHREDTVVMFLSDHGMPLPFAKTAVWYHSTRTPWIVRWPGVTKPGRVDRAHMISAVDLLPTLLEIANVEPPEGMDGRSFLPTIHGQRQAGRDWVYTFHNENSGRNRSPMRSIQSQRFGYIFNPWSDGKRVFKTATTGTLTYRAMQELAKDDPVMARRLDLFEHRVPEEFYDYEHDPDALHNLIGDPRYTEELRLHREAMLTTMRASGDPVLPVLQHRHDSAVSSAYVDRVQAEADARRAAERKRQPPQKKQNPKLFRWSLPDDLRRDAEVALALHYALPKRLGRQKVHVTLKDADGKRLHRIVREVEGTGDLSVTFSADLLANTSGVRLAAFIGPSYQRNLLHRASGLIPLTD